MFLIFFLLKKKQFFNIFSAGIKKKWAGINFLLLEISLLKSFFFLLKKNIFFNTFSAGIKKKWAGTKKKWAGIKYFGLELFFLLNINVFKFFEFFWLKKSNF